MGRKTGRDTKVEIEIGASFYAMSALSSVASPAADIGKKFVSGVSYISDQESLQPDIRLDGVISGFSISPHADYNTVEVTAGRIYLKGQEVTVEATEVGPVDRPTSTGMVLVTALSVNASGVITATSGIQGASTSTRGAAGGPPFIPVDEVLIGYINATYFDGSVSGAKVLTASEIDAESKERVSIPSYKIHYHDGFGTTKTDLGAIEFASALPLIHAATGPGPGTGRRNVYASYYEPSFEELPDSKDFSINEDIQSIKSMAYGESNTETSLGIESWSASGSAYWKAVSDVLSLIKNTKRWVKIYPDKNKVDHWTGRGVIKVNRTLPSNDTLGASISVEGSGRLYEKTA